MQLNLFDMQGRVVRRQEAVQAPMRLSLRELPTEVYWLRMIRGNTEMWQLVIKQ